MRTKPSPHDIRRIAVLGFVHPYTIQRFYRGDPVRSTSSARIIDAARVLGIDLPEPGPAAELPPELLNAAARR